LPNPFLDLAVTGLEAQLKFWQAFQVEGARFVAKRMRNNLEHLRSLGHCCEAEAMGDAKSTRTMPRSAPASPPLPSL
jgi:hypothetical protein